MKAFATESLGYELKQNKPLFNEECSNLDQKKQG